MNQNELNRSQITILAISYLGLKTKKQVYPSTEEVAVHCPFHKDKTPSMFIDIKNGRYNCFSCGNHGSIESLFRSLTGDDLYKTLGINNNPFSNFARNLNPTYNQNNDFSIKVESTKKSVYVNLYKDDFESAISNPLSLRYFLKRGISRKVAESMHFMYCKDTTINTTHFVNRLCIPIYENGVLCSVEGRKILSDDFGPKVLYPKNTSVDLLYDIDNLNTEETLYACEGLMDLSLLRDCTEFKNSTSIFGAKVTNRQLEQLSRFKKVVYIADNDDAGNSTLDTLKESGLDNMYKLKLPNEINGEKIKDIGDLPKVKSSVRELLNKKWLNRIEKL